MLFSREGKIKNSFMTINPATPTSEGREAFISWYSVCRL
jgi:hypothetical protein